MDYRIVEYEDLLCQAFLSKYLGKAFLTNLNHPTTY